MSDASKEDGATGKGPTSVKMIAFSGKEREWREWSKKVIAFGTMKGWVSAILGENKATAKQKSDAMSFLTMSLTGKAFAFVEDATDPHVVWCELNDEFEPCEEVDIYDLQEEFTRCKLKSNRENPTMWFKRLDHLNDRLRKVDPKYVKDDDQVKIHIRVHLPETEYSELITSTRDDLKRMSSKEFKNKIKSHWRRLTRNESSNEQGESENSEKVLQAASSNENKDERSNKIGSSKNKKGSYSGGFRKQFK